MDPSVADAARQGLTLGPLLQYVERVAKVQGINARDAANFLIHLSQQSGDPDTLIVEGRSVPAYRHDIMATGDWTVTTLDPDIAVCVAGGREVAVPQLQRADMKLWEVPLSEQVDDMSQRN
jgi:hypothetical protein